MARVASLAGEQIRTERLRRRWTLRQLADAAGLAVSHVHAAEAGLTVSTEAYCRMAAALGMRVEVTFTDPRRRDRVAGADLVHAAMGEIQVARFQSFELATGIDEPYQHYQFAGRADVVAWDLERRALIQIENRTRFPDVQATAGSWNGKRRYLPAELASRLGVGRWASVTNVMVALWSDEVVEVVRSHAATFQALCPDRPTAFEGWWQGDPPLTGSTSSFVLFDPVAKGKAPRFVASDDVLGGPAPHRGYASVARRLRVSG